MIAYMRILFATSEEFLVPSNKAMKLHDVIQSVHFEVNTLNDVDVCIRMLLITFLFFQFFELFIIVKVFTWVW